MKTNHWSAHTQGALPETVEHPEAECILWLVSIDSLICVYPAIWKCCNKLMGLASQDAECIWWLVRNDNIHLCLSLCAYRIWHRHCRLDSPALAMSTCNIEVSYQLQRIELQDATATSCGLHQNIEWPVNTRKKRFFSTYLRRDAAYHREPTWCYSVLKTQSKVQP